MLSLFLISFKFSSTSTYNKQIFQVKNENAKIEWISNALTFSYTLSLFSFQKFSFELSILYSSLKLSFKTKKVENSILFSYALKVFVFKAKPKGI